MGEPAVIEYDLIFTDPVLVAFNPLAVSEGDPLREVFADATARTLWLSWRPRHIVNQYFADEVLLLASLVRANSPRSGRELAQLVRARFTFDAKSNFRSSLIDAWADQVFPYLGNEAPLAWSIYRQEEERP